LDLETTGIGAKEKQKKGKEGNNNVADRCLRNEQEGADVGGNRDTS